jgi:tRNA G18 (ribose-2'-O)-methylase SpoU
LLCFALPMQPIWVDDVSDPRLADYRDVRDADLRRKRGLFMAEGRFVVDVLLRDSRYAPDSFFLNPKSFEALEPVINECGGDAPVYVAKQEVFSDVVGFDMHRGCLAVGNVGEALGFEVLIAQAAKEASLVIVVEGLRNTENMGGIFRNAMAFGASAVLMCPESCDPLYRKAIRVSMGGTLCIPFAQVTSWPAGLSRLRDAGFQLVALDLADDAIPLDELGLRIVPDRPVALLLGTEGRGISEAALDQVDHAVRIQMAPGVDSLNVATASGIAMHAVFAGNGGSNSKPGAPK